MQAQDTQGKTHYIHSKIAPSRETNTINHKQIQSQSNVLTIGMGLGYQWQRHNIGPAIQKIFILAENFDFLEHNIDLIEKIFQKKARKKQFLLETAHSSPKKIVQEYFHCTALSTIDDPIKSSVQSSKSKIPTNQEHEIFIFNYQHLTQAIQYILTINSADSLVLHYYSPIYRIWPEPKPNLEQILKKSLANKEQNNATVSHFAILWHKHSILNLANVANAANAMTYIKEIQSLSKPDMPVFIAGASPGLQYFLENAQHRQLVKNHCLILAADSAEGVLDYWKLEPHIVIAADASAFCVNQIPWQSKNPDIVRLYNMVVHPALIFNQKQKSTPVFFFRNHPWEQLLTQHFDLTFTGLTGTNVGLMALDLALRLNSNTILMAGMDMSYASAQTYSLNTPYSSFFMTRYNRLLPLPQQFINQIARTRAYCQPEQEDALLYRRHSLDQGLTALSEWYSRAMSQDKQVFFCHIPKSIYQEITGKKYDHKTTSSWQNFLSKYENHPAQTRHDIHQALQKSMVLDCLSKSDISNFLRIYADKLPKTMTHLLNLHWPAEKKFLQKRFKQTLRHLTNL